MQEADPVLLALAQADDAAGAHADAGVPHVGQCLEPVLGGVTTIANDSRHRFLVAKASAGKDRNAKASQQSARLAACRGFNPAGTQPGVGDPRGAQTSYFRVVVIWP